MKTVIMAGGKGTRIAERFPDIPKPLIPIKDKNGIEKPVLEWELLSLRDQGFTEILITVSHMADKIQSYFGDGSNLGMSIKYFVENVPLGNAGALFKVRDWLGSEPFLLLNADAVFDIDFNRFTAFHEKKRKECDALVTLFTHPNSHPYDSGLIVSDENGAVSQWLTKEDTRPEWYKNRVNAGLHVIDPKVLENINSSVDVEHIGETVNGKVIKVDLDRQILKPLCGTQKMYCYDSPEYVKDMGTPERYEQVCRDFQAGTIEAKNLKHPQKAIFLDRDGTINKYVGFLRDIDQFELIDGVAEAIKKINESGYLCIVVTNQPVIARGEVTTSQLQEIHNKMETLLGKAGAYIDGLYYCPHHPDKGFEGEVVELKIDCECRKPKPGMLLKAAQDFNIDLSKSWMIGDGENDVKAGIAAGCQTIRIVDENSGGKTITPTTFVDDLLRAVRLIEVLDRLDLEIIDPHTQYVLCNKIIGQALWLFKKSEEGHKSLNGEMFVGDLADAVNTLIYQDNFDDFELMTLEQYSRLQDALIIIRKKREEEIIANARDISVDQIEYKDHFFIDCMPGITTRIIKFTTYLQWFMKDDFKALKERLFEGLNLNKEPRRNADDVISGILATTKNEFEKKTKDKNYYESNVAVIMFVVRYIFTSDLLETLKVADKDERTRFLVKNYQSILSEILLNVEDICSLYSSEFGIKNNDRVDGSVYLSSIRSRFVSTASIHQILRQELYGSVSFHSFADKNISASIGTIRQLVELRIRRSFGILCLEDYDNIFVPLNMTKLFDVIGKHREDIQFPLRFENIVRIYSWSNNYIHSGLGDYPWIPFYLELIMREFSFGKTQKDGSWSVNNGVIIKKNTLDDIERELLDLVNTDKEGNKIKKYKLLKCKPECEMI